MQPSDPCESIPDSEDDEEILKSSTVPKAITSTISQFTASNAPKPVEKTSPVSEFTLDKDKPPKGRVRPQPRKPRVVSSTSDSIDSPATAGPSRLNTFDTDANERQERLLKLKGWNIPPRPPQEKPAQNKSSKEIIEVSSDPEIEITWSRSKSLPDKSEKEKGAAAAAAAFDGNPGMSKPLSSLPIAPDTSILPPSDPPSSSSGLKSTNLPSSPKQSNPVSPSSSVIVTSRKRPHKLVMDDDQEDFPPRRDFMDTSSDFSLQIMPLSSPSKYRDDEKTEKQDKPKKERTKKATKVDKEAKSAKAKKPKPLPAKKRNKTAESENSRTALFKSAEFIFDSSDDEIALQSSSKPGTMQKSVPPSADISAPPSVPISVPPTVLITTKPPKSSSAIASDEELKRLYNAAAGGPPFSSGDESDPEESQALRSIKMRMPLSERPSQQRRNKETAATVTQPSKQERPANVTKGSSKGKRTATIISDSSSEDEAQLPTKPPSTKPASTHSKPQTEKAKDGGDKENVDAATSGTASIPPTPSVTSNPRPRPPTRPRTSSPYIMPRKGSMSDFIRRASSKVNSPFASPAPTYSPLAKSSKVALSRIAPLHVSRRTPPPPPPRPPPPKKTKKELDREEKWEMELADTVEGWSCMSEVERAAMMRAKRDMELGYDD